MNARWPTPDSAAHSFLKELAADTAPTRQLRRGRTLGFVYTAWIFALGGGQLFTLLLFVMLSPNEVGLINIATASGALVFYVAEGGLETALVMTAKVTPVDLRSMTRVVGLVRALTAISLGGVWAVLRLTNAVPGRLSEVLLLVGSALAIRSLQTPFAVALQIRNRQGIVSLVSLSSVLVRLGLLALFILSRRVTAESALLANLVSEVVGLTVLAAVARSDASGQLYRNSDRALLVRLLKAAPAITASQLTIIVQGRADWVLVGTLLSYRSLANYALANKGIELILLGGSVLGRNALPWFVEGWHGSQIRRTIGILLAGSSAAGLLLATVGPMLILRVFGDKYSLAPGVLPILAALAPALFLQQILYFAVVGRGGVVDATIVGIFAIVAQIAVDLLTLRRFGITGAAMGMCAFTGVVTPGMLLAGIRRGVFKLPIATEFGVYALVLPVVVGLLELSHLIPGTP